MSPGIARAGGPLASWLGSGELSSHEDIVRGGVDAFPDALLRLFRGENLGKLILALDDESDGNLAVSPRAYD